MEERVRSILKQLGWVCAFGFVLGATACDVEQTEPGEAPEVEVEEGEMPEYDVDTAEVEVGTEKEVIETPDIDVEMPEEDEPAVAE